MAFSIKYVVVSNVFLAYSDYLKIWSNLFVHCHCVRNYLTKLNFAKLKNHNFEDFFRQDCIIIFYLMQIDDGVDKERFKKTCNLYLHPRQYAAVTQIIFTLAILSLCYTKFNNALTRWCEIEWSHIERGFHIVHKSKGSLFSKCFEGLLIVTHLHT